VQGGRDRSDGCSHNEAAEAGLEHVSSACRRAQDPRCRASGQTSRRVETDCYRFYDTNSGGFGDGQDVRSVTQAMWRGHGLCRKEVVPLTRPEGQTCYMSRDRLRRMRSCVRRPAKAALAVIEKRPKGWETRGQSGGSSCPVSRGSGWGLRPILKDRRSGAGMGDGAGQCDGGEVQDALDDAAKGMTTRMMRTVVDGAGRGTSISCWMRGGLWSGVRTTICC